MVLRFFALPVVQFAANQLQSALGDPVGPAAGGADGPFRFQFPKQQQVEVWIAPALAGKAIEAFDAPFFVSGEFDPAALGEQVENALFGA